MLLQKTLKSIQLHLHGLIHQLELLGDKCVNSVTAGAWTRARSKLKHTAFIELNEELLIKEFYKNGHAGSFKGFRLLAIDGSVIALPDSKEIYKHFGREKSTNQVDGFSKYYSQGQCSVLYDLINRLAVKASLKPYQKSELSQAKNICLSLDEKDILIADRAYGSSEFMSNIQARGADFVIRLAENRFKAAQALFDAKEAGKSVVAQIAIRKGQSRRTKGERMQVRFVSLQIPSTGEREVLVTSLLDESSFPTQSFLEIYNKRWGIETYFHQLKNRLDLENFTGKTVESIYQDFYAMLFVSNYETILIGPAEKDLDKHKSAVKKDNKRINHSVSYHLIKDYALELFFSKIPEDRLVEKLTELFKYNLHYERNRGPTDRIKTSPVTSARFRKNVRKITF